MLFKAGLTVLVLAATVQAEDKVARLYRGSRFSGGKLDIKLNNECVTLKGDFFHEAASIAIPCPDELPEGKKAICTLFQSPECKEEDAIYSSVTYERSHYNMYRRTTESPYDVGSLTSSVKCELVDADKEIEKGYNHISTTSESACVGKSCGSDDDCPRNSLVSFYCAKSEENTCQRLRVDGAECNADGECEDGLCCPYDDQKKCLRSCPAPNCKGPGSVCFALAMCCSGRCNFFQFTGAGTCQ